MDENEVKKVIKVNTKLNKILEKIKNYFAEDDE